jgi:hypothetical protein
MVVEITKTEYTKFVDAALDAFTAQCRGADGWEIQFGAEKPVASEPGVIIPSGLGNGVTRTNGAGHGWAKLPASAGAPSADVVVIG